MWSASASPSSASFLRYLSSMYPSQKQKQSYHLLIIHVAWSRVLGRLSKLAFVEPVPGAVQLVRTVFPLPSSLVIPNPVTAAVHTMGNPIMTQLCVEIKTHVGYGEESYLLELKGNRVCCCAFTGDGWIVLNVHLPIRLHLDGIQRGSRCC